MSKRIEFVKDFYAEYSEEGRLQRSRQGQLEFLTTMEYIHKYAKKGDKVLEVGAGTGKYSITLAKEGFQVDAFDLSEHNLEILKKNAENELGSSASEKLRVSQGDATDLHMYKDEYFDITLVLGPLYHLYTDEERKAAIDEAIRVTKRDGIVIFAFLSVFAIIFVNYFQGNLIAGLEENFDDAFDTRHFENQLFTGYMIEEFEALFEGKGTEWLKTVAVDGILEMAEHRADFEMSDEEFAEYAKMHLATCEKRELLGASSHLIYICKKK